jgi:NADPH:quinone reductase-like Zn-dependent oxidoreductase
MHAVVQGGYGGPEVLDVKEVPRPEPGPGQVLVRVAAAGVNPADWKTRAGAEGHRFFTPPFTPGLDLAGIVEAAGPDAAGFEPGQPVYGMVFPPRGAQAEYTLTAAGMLAAVPQGVDLVQAGALATAGLTAWQALVNTAQVDSGTRILIHAAAGGVGHLAVQIARARGAYVIATASPGKHDFLHRLGAHETIDYTTADFSQALASNVDVVLDPIGNDYGPLSLRLLEKQGIYVDVRQPNPYREELRALADELHVRYADVTVSPNTADLTALIGLAVSGQLQVAVERTLPLASVATAQELIQAGRTTGKIVLIPGRGLAGYAADVGSGQATAPSAG